MTGKAEQDHATPEFVFGPLSTEAGRVARARAEGVGLQHADELRPRDPRPGEAVEVAVRAGLGVDLRSAILHYSLDGSLPAPGSPASVAVAMVRTAIHWETVTWSFVATWTGRIPGQPAGTSVRYLVTALDTEGRALTCPEVDAGTPALAGRPDAFDEHYLHQLQRARSPQVYAYVVDELAIPGWLRDAVLYEVFIDRFAPDPGRSFASTDDLSAFHGGTLRGVLDRLPYLVDLGVTCLWLTPITASPSHHGYDPVDLRRVEPRLGCEADLRELTDAAHAAGLRVVLDFVANHVSSQHPAFQAAQASPSSEYRDWFLFRHWPGDYEAYYDIPELPIVDTDVPAVREERIEAARHWLRLGCDGFRLDHAHGATHAFWSSFRTAIREENAEAVTFGEITDTPARVRSYAGRMDGALDFQLLELLRGFFGHGSLTASQLERGLRSHEAYVGDTLVLPSFLDNHDTNRFLWTVGGDVRRLKLAALCQFTLPGPPIIYYGTEVGLSQRRGLGRLEEARLPMTWDERQDRELLRFYRDLIALRRATGWRAWADREPLLVDDERGLLAYRCREHVVVLNNAETPVDVELPAGDLVLATDTGVTDQAMVLHLPPRSGAVRRLQDPAVR